MILKDGETYNNPCLFYCSYSNLHPHYSNFDSNRIHADQYAIKQIEIMSYTGVKHVFF